MRVSHLREALKICPSDIATRCELAKLLEERGEIKNALLHWRLVVKGDPNNLQAWQGIARCRQNSSGTAKP